MFIIAGMITAGSAMKISQAADVTYLTDLTSRQLREWSSRDRRNLVPIDVEPSGAGQHALYSWQTILVLRLLKRLYVDFAVKIGVGAHGVVEFRKKLENVSFLSLWGALLYLESRCNLELVSVRTVMPLSGAVLLLDPHLRPIATKLANCPPDQLFLFPTAVVTL